MVTAPIIMKVYNCLSCNKECQSNNRNKNKYCGASCQHEYQNSLKVQKWLLTGIIVRVGTANWVKKYLFKEQDGKCNHCKNEFWMGKPINLELEHIDGNSENNKRENLELICPNCHSYTPTYKALNKGNGRQARREKYKNK